MFEDIEEFDEFLGIVEHSFDDARDEDELEDECIDEEMTTNVEISANKTQNFVTI